MINLLLKKYGFKLTGLIFAVFIACAWFAYIIITGVFLLEAANRGQVDDVVWLLRIGAPVNALDPELRCTPLIFAAANGHEQVVHVLLSKGGDPNRQDNEGETALMMAVANGYVPVVNTLLEAGARREIKNQSGETALDHAKKRGDPTIIALLNATTTVKYSP
jgi:ankyrin repeat protein